MRVGLVIVLLVTVAGALPAAAPDDAAAKERARQILLYGIDSQVLDAIQKLKAAQDSSFTTELAQILADNQRAPELRKTVLNLFQDQKLKDGEQAAKDILAGWQDAQSALLVAAVQYLSAIGSAGLSPALTPLVDSSDSAVASAGIQALGHTADPAAADLLVAKLKSADFPDARKSDLILALGSLGNAAAVEPLLAIAGSQDEDKVRRMYAADSLGKIGDPRALPVLRSMFAENDALIRLYAASALSHFSLDEVFPSLLQGLRDENSKVREQSAKTLARQLSASQSAAAVPILSFKAELDPDSSVRLASIQALGEIGGDAAMKLLLTIYSGADNPLDSREAALGILVTKSLATSLDAIRVVIDAEWKDFDQRPLESTAKVLSTAKGAELRQLYLRFLESPDAVVRSYGIRGIAGNRFSDLKDRVKQIADKDPNPGTRQEASNSLAKF